MFGYSLIEIGIWLLAFGTTYVAVRMVRSSWATVPPWPLRADSGPLAVIAFFVFMSWFLFTGAWNGGLNWLNGLLEIVVDSESNRIAIGNAAQCLGRLTSMTLALVLCYFMVDPADPIRQRPVVSWRRLAWSFGLYFLALPLVISLAPNIDNSDSASQEAVDQLLAQTQFLPRSALFANVVLAAPLFEEILFRGLMQGALRRHLDASVSIVIASGFFAVLHPGFRLPVFVLGIVLGILYERGRGIILPLSVHFLHNFLTFLYVIYVMGSAQ